MLCASVYVQWTGMMKNVFLNVTIAKTSLEMNI